MAPGQTVMSEWTLGVEMFFRRYFIQRSTVVLATAASMFAASTSGAATFNADAYIAMTGPSQYVSVSCDGPTVGAASAAVSQCTVDGEVVSRAEIGNGYLRAFAKARYETTGSSELPEATNGWVIVPGSIRQSSVSTFFSDEVDFVGVGSGVFRLHLDLLGAQSVADTSSGIFGIGNGATFAETSFGITDQRSTNAPTFSTFSRKEIGINAQGEKVLRTTGTSDLVSFVDIEIRDGRAVFYGGASAIASCWAPGVSVGGPVHSCSSITNFSSSLRFTGATIFDANGTNITGEVSASSSSGFDYITGVAGHDRMSAVPVPASLPMLLIGLAALGFAARSPRRV